LSLLKITIDVIIVLPLTPLFSEKNDASLEFIRAVKCHPSFPGSHISKIPGEISDKL
jgi:hypothetical protein